MDVVSSLAAAEAGTLLRDLPPATRDRLFSGALRRRFAAGEVCFRSSDAQPRGGLVIEGLLRVYLQASDGRAVTIFHARRGSLVGVVTALVGAAAPVWIRAVTDAEVLELEVDHIRSIAATDAEFSWALAREVSRRLIDTVDVLADASFGTPRARLARLLLDLAVPGDAPGTLVVTATQQALAEGIGTVREVVARGLASFREERVLSTGHGHITISDPGSLAAIVGRWMTRS